MSTALSTSLHIRLNTLSDIIKQTQSQINRLAQLRAKDTTSRPASPNPQPTLQRTDSTDSQTDDPVSLRAELSAEIHESLKKQEEGLELVRQEVEDFVGVAHSGAASLEREREKSRLSVQVIRLGEDLKHARSSYRKAQLRAKRTHDASKAASRSLYIQTLRESALAASQPPPPENPTQDHDPSTLLKQQPLRRTNNQQSRHARRHSEEIILDASNDVTTALRRTLILAENSVTQADYAKETLARSTAQLQELDQSYSSVDELLSRSKSLLSTLVSSQKSDTWYLETAFWILVSTVGWLIFRRWLYGPFWLLVLFPLRVGYRTFFAFLAAFGITSSGSSSAKVGIAESQGVRVQASLASNVLGDVPSVVVAASKASEYSVQRERDVYREEDRSLVEEIGEMAEASRQAAQGQVRGEEGKEPVMRGDGTVLEESNAPRNPKKRTFNTGVEEPVRGSETKMQQDHGQGKAVDEGQIRDEL